MDDWTLRYFMSFFSVCPVAILVLGMSIPYNGMREVENAYLRVNSQCFSSVVLLSAHTVHLCVLCGSENKQRLFPYTVFTDFFF